MKTAIDLHAKIISAFPGSASLYPERKDELEELWSALPLLDAQGVLQLLPCLMLSALDASEMEESLNLADQIVYYLDGYEHNRPPELRDLTHKVKVFEEFSYAQIKTIREWLKNVSVLRFTESAQSELNAALRYWQDMEEDRKRH